MLNFELLKTDGHARRGRLTLNHGVLDVFMHPNTGDSLRDHRDCAAWIGRRYTLNLKALGA